MEVRETRAGVMGFVSLLCCCKWGREQLEHSVSVSLIMKCLFHTGEELHAGH